jgi:polar amino acid transport system substrate-binding protein
MLLGGMVWDCFFSKKRRIIENWRGKGRDRNFPGVAPGRISKRGSMFTMKRLTLAASAAAIALTLAACSQEETKTAEPAPAPAPAEPMAATPAPAPAEPAPAPAPAEPAAAPAPAAPADPAKPSSASLKIGTEGAYPPFNNLTADGKLEGFDIDIANALCAEMKVTCEFVTQDWDGIIPALEAGKFDAIIASMSITDERKQKVDFTHKYYQTPGAVVTAKTSDIKGVSKEDLAGKTIGVATATTHLNYAEKTYTDSTLKAYPTSVEFLLDMANGRLDAVSDDISVLEGWLATADGACCKLIGAITPVPEIHGEGAGIAVRKGETDLANKFNAAIDAIRANGKYKEINDKYFKYDVYGSAS